MKIFILAGAIAQMAGLIVIFFFSTSPLHSNAGATYMFNNEEQAEIEKAEKRRKLKAMLGYILCLAGIAIQIITVFF